MKKQLLLIFLLSFIIYNTAAQKKEIFYGKVYDSITALQNAHLINLQTKQGTYTNNAGEFRIFVSINDSIQISSIGYKTKIHIVKNLDFGLRKNNFKLQKTDYELDEVIIKKHNLIGLLEIDAKKIPDDKVSDLMGKLLNGISNIDMSKVTRDIDAVNRMKAPVLNSVPPNFFRGVTFFNSDWLKKSNKKTPIKKINHLEKKAQLSTKIINSFGKKTFVNEFKIPENKIHQFINYCSYRDLEKLFYQKKMIKIITIFQEESPKFLKSIK